MKHIYLVIPLVATIAFGGYYAFWNNFRAEPQREKLRRPRIDDTYYLAQYKTRDGAQEAREDIHNGRLILKRGGCAFDPSITEYWAILEERYGVKQDAILGPFTTEAASKYVSSYNKVVWSYLSEQFGITSAQLSEEAQIRYRAKRKAASKPVQRTGADARR